MIQHLDLVNVGPAPSMNLEFGKRLNLFTGDNGLGKSFLLDIAWWSLTRKWPAEINNKLTAGKKAVPAGSGEATIRFSLGNGTASEAYESMYSRKEQAWLGRPGRPANSALVLYAMSDGSFAIWDPARNYWQTRNGVDVQDRRPAYVFHPGEVWDGLLAADGTWLCNGLVRDWAGWLKEKGAPFEYLKEVLEALSPSKQETLTPGQLTRISLDDVRDMPTISMPYQQDVAVIHASAGMRRVMALAYFLVWAWQEHRQASKQLQEPETNRVIFLIDEIESHLHPRWQRTIVPALMTVMNRLATEAEIQLLTATHSPLIMASVEPFFDNEKDAWFDLDFAGGQVSLKHREFQKHGEAGSWLTSEAFDLKSGRSLAYESLIEDASALLQEEAPDLENIKKVNSALVQALSPKDEFLFNWRYICRRKGWLE
ncbi:AAA family ATPase [Sulfidibacter corallicola]|uniref:AAA family ATPase n=1 Tax=Sulfidibacter corallicola TaxID=2818388 RepID=A0A8A4TSV6_SULCO|nr:ATP-binding protein [Sulfidibacter corallicola]QTD52244.1 AAA family ATPase [Sulfidibacter corallicola]